MVHYQNKRLVVDGGDALLLSGEVHYFRLARGDWQDRVDKAKAAGLDTIATYVPWIWHELPDGSFDLTGRTRPERDLGAFVDLCHASGLRVIARPGPFVMAELKNEGLPHRLHRQHPTIVPTGWDGAPAPTATVDYLAPAFLAEARRWYEAVMPVLAPRLRPAGGPVVAVQLDNEVGMLAWVSNTPDLTDHLIDDFDGWLRRRHGDALTERYSFAGRSTAERRAAVRHPDDSCAAALMNDLGRFMRGRFARYLAELRGYAENCGITGVPFLVNIHGTADGRAESFPVGISQLMECYAGIPGMVSGSDIYLGDLTIANAADLYLVNAFMDAVHDDDQPLTSMEFEAGDGDYGCTLGAQSDPSAVDLKTRMCLAQGNRLLNYYLFTGGVNPPLDEPVGDGNDRLGFTGERHGFAAPVDPEGRPGPSYEPTARVVRTARAMAPWLAGMREEHDALAIGFVPDHYLTEYHHPGSPAVQAVLDDVVGTRGAGPGGVLARAMLLGGFRFPAVDLQAGTPDPLRHPVIALACPEHLPAEVQEHLSGYLRAGGGLLLAGRVPDKDMTGGPCTVLRDTLGLRPLGELNGSPGFFPSVTAHGWAAPRAETRVNRVQLFEAPGATTVLRELTTGHGCGFDIPVGAGRAVVVAADHPCDLDLWRSAFAVLGAVPALRHTARVPGLVVLSAAGTGGGRILHALNLSGYDQEFTVTERAAPLFGGHTLRLPGRRALMLPLGLELGGLRTAWATAEACRVDDDSVVFRAPGGEAVVAVEGPAVCDDPAAVVGIRDGLTVIEVRGRQEFTVHRV